MISKINCLKEVYLNRFQKNESSKSTKNNTNVNYTTMPMSKEAADAFKSYAVTFGAKKEEDIISPAKIMANYMNMDGQVLLSNAVDLANNMGNPEVNQLHVLYVGLSECLNQIEELEEGKNSIETYDPYGAYLVLVERYNNRKLITDENCRERLKDSIEMSLDYLENQMSDLPTGESVQAKISDDYLQDIVSDFKQLLSSDPGAQIDGTELVYTALNANGNKKMKAVTKDLDKIIASEIYLDDISDNDSLHIQLYDERANNVWKNINLGTNMVIIHDKSTDKDTLLKSLYSTFENSNGQFGNISPKNTDITVLNEYATLSFIIETLDEIKKDTDKNHIIVVKNLQKNIYNSFPEDLKNQSGMTEDTIMYPDPIGSRKLLNLPSNIKYIVLADKDYYYGVQAQNGSSKDGFFYNFCEVNIPVISSSQAKEMFKNNSELTKDLKKKFSPAAVQKCVEASSRMSGNYPDKTIQLMEKISAYYIDKNKEITPKDVDKYLKEANGLFKTNDDNDSVKMIFDMDKRLKDIVGKESTKREAAAIVKQIKSGRIGTKGYVVYSQDGSAGSGRRHTAQAIAGEAKIPYAEINTMDFATKEVSIFGGASQSPESSIKKLFAMIKAQAEENPQRAAILFVENFEYFAVGEMVSEYHQKAMAQLLREMENAQKQGLNIVVMGSVSDPRFIGEAATKSFKFIDRLEISSPAINEDARFDIIKDAIKKEKIKLDTSSQQETDELIEYAADITEGFPFINIKSLVKKAQTVALERGHRLVDKSDITEAYLQITTGRPSISYIPHEEKMIVTSHECGHATNLEVMNNVAKNLGKPWHVPGKVNFVTLDPRGFYGGAVYHGEDGNQERSFESNFADIVCAYGGHSAEKCFYDMDGSFGITADLEHATSMAEAMVMIMGQGHDTGKISIHKNMRMSSELRRDTERDIRRILENALSVSDLITEYYADFNVQFTEKYSNLVGTGECLIDGDTFRKELRDWRKSQSLSKQEELDLLDRMIIDIMRDTKRGKIY